MLPGPSASANRAADRRHRWANRGPALCSAVTAPPPLKGERGARSPPPTAPKIFNVAPTLNKKRGSSGYIRVIFSLVRKRAPSGSNPNPGSFLDGAWGRRRSPLGRGRGGRFVRPRRQEGLSGARGRRECAEPRQARWQVEEKERGKMGAGARSGVRAATGGGGWGPHNLIESMPPPPGPDGGLGLQEGPSGRRASLSRARVSGQPLTRAGITDTGACIPEGRSRAASLKRPACTTRRGQSELERGRLRNCAPHTPDGPPPFGSSSLPPLLPSTCSPPCSRLGTNLLLCPH
uniref:Uncharacterized protein n=1 Tax=Rangifer tarandus platyrhynchus TaxID=3082113 RepID=A0ACB0F2D3_RANTA|nr:unnamed protein product [Rangifer tarandus platyrhynchus]